MQACRISLRRPQKKREILHPLLFHHVFQVRAWAQIKSELRSFLIGNLRIIAHAPFGGGKSMMEPGLQELLLDSLFTYSLLILGSFLSVFPEQTVNLLHEFSTIIPAVKLRDILAVQIYRLYGVILIGHSSFTMFRVYSAQL
jgi:hypothetical protein